MNRINQISHEYFPCNFCYYFGYFSSFFTIGLSFLCPNICISQAESVLIEELDIFNKNPIYCNKNVKWKYVKKCCYTYIELKKCSNDV